MSDQPIELPAVDAPEGEHPVDGLTDAEAEAGHRVYKAVDDLDDESNGLDDLQDAELDSLP